MAIHSKDRNADTPRLQCACCGKWKRLHGRDPKTGEHIYLFFGGCGYTGGDHLCAKTADTNDVCDDCCQTECKGISAAHHKRDAERRRVDRADPFRGLVFSRIDDRTGKARTMNSLSWLIYLAQVLTSLGYLFTFLAV